MASESTAGIIEKYTAEPAAVDLFESRNQRLKAKAGIFLGIIASAAALSPAPALSEKSDKTTAIPYVGFFEQDILTNNLETDRTIAKEIKAAGGNDVEFRINYTEPSSSDVGDQWNTMCVAAQAAQEQGLSISINFQTYKRGGIIGWIPQSLTELKHFDTYVVTYEDGLIGPAYTGNDKVAHRCPNLKSSFKRIRFSIGGEPNYETLFSPQYDSQGNFVAPENAVHLMASAAPALQREAKRLNAQVDVSMGDLTPAKDPIGFVTKMGEVIRAENIDWPKIAVGVNGYWPNETPGTQHPGGTIVRPVDLPNFIKSATDAFGYKPTIVIDEMGAEPTVPLSEMNHYASVDESNSWVDEGGQALQYRQALGLYACMGVKEVNIFHLRDDATANSYARSGIEFADGSQKLSYNSVSWSILDALNGNYQCANNK